MQDTLTSTYSPAAFRALGHRLVDLLADHLEYAADPINERVIDYRDPETELAYWQEDFRRASPADDPLDFFRDVVRRSTHVQHPRCFGHQLAVPSPVAALAGLTSDILSNGTGVYEMGMASNALERIVTEFTAARIGYPATAAGFLTSGGTLANLTALLAARAAKAPAVWSDGHADRLAVLVSEEAHYCVDRAARIMGMGADGIRKIPVDDRYKIRTDLLEECYRETLAAGLTPIAAIGCAGSTATGSYDDLHALADFAERHDLWYHVDGAHGGAVAFSDTYRDLATGMERADTIVLDYHKMLMTPALTTAVLFREGHRSYHTFAQRAQYLWEAERTPEWYHSGKRTFECTKLMMSIKIYATLRAHGSEIFGDNVTRLYDNARTFAELLRAAPDFELALTPESNILNFRYTDLPRADWDAKNGQIRQRLIDRGGFYLVQTVLNGERWLRTALMNPFTTAAHWQELLETIRSFRTEL